MRVYKNAVGWSENSSDIIAGWPDGPFLHCINGKKSLRDTRENNEKIAAGWSEKLMSDIPHKLFR